jgi:thiamine transport system permease protein
VKQAFFSTLCALALGLPGAWVLGTGRFRGSALVRGISAIPFAMPPILVALAFVLFFGNAGWINRAIVAGRDALFPGRGAGGGPLRILYKPEAIILAHGFYNFPLVIRLVGDRLYQARRSYAAAAATLGAGGIKTALTILLPLSLSPILAAALLCFLYSFTSFAVVLVLGGGPAATTLAVEIYRYARISLDYSAAGFFALIETLVACGALALHLFFNRRTGAGETGGIPAALERRDRSPPVFLLAVLYGAVLIVLVAGPLLSVPLESFLSRATRSAAPELSLRWWSSLPRRILPALGRSLLLAFLSAGIASVLAVLAAAPSGGKGGFGSSLIRLVTIAPLASSGIVLGLGWIILYGREHIRSLWALAAFQAVISLPFACSSVAEGFRTLPAGVLAAASVLGAGPVRRLFTVAVPLAAPRIRGAWGFAAAISLGELNGALMMGMEDWETLPLLVYRAAGAYRYGTACAAGTLLLLCCAGAFLLAETGFPDAAAASPGRTRRFPAGRAS